jgi:hypothetical protein
MTDSPVLTEPLRPAMMLRIKREYRRVAIYLIIGYVVLVGAIVGLNLAGLGGGWDLALFGLLVFSVLLLALPVLIFRQRLRINHAGVWRRRLFHWDLWPWEAFTSGEVKRGTYHDSFVYPSKPWWHRYLFLEFLESGEREAVARLLVELSRPAAIELPENLRLHYGFRKWLFLSPEGVRLGTDQQTPGALHTWSDVRQVRVKRIEHTRTDFHHLELDLPKPAPLICLRVFKGSPTWSGADADVILAFLQRHAGSEHIQITALTGPPRDAEECERRLRELESNEQQLRRLRRWLVPVMAIVEATFPAYLLLFGRQPANPLQWHWTQLFAFGSCLTLLALLGVGVWMSLAELLARVQKQRKELEAWRARQARE